MLQTVPFGTVFFIAREGAAGRNFLLKAVFFRFFNRKMKLTIDSLFPLC